MSDDEKKPDKLFFDEKTGILHGSECPKTKKEFKEDGGGDHCALESFLKQKYEEIREAIPYQPDAASTIGPAQVATKQYRDGYDRIFGTKPTMGKA